MKRLFTSVILGIFLFTNLSVPAQAGFFADKKAEITKNRQERKARKDIERVLAKQDKYASKFDHIGLSTLYSQDFVSADGITKNEYFELVKETWESYPDITYTSEIKDIKINGSKAAADVYETSLAAVTQIEEGVKIYGELTSHSNGTYYFTKTNGKWLISGEKISDEKSYLKYGDTRFINMELNAPKSVKPGEYYTSTLTIDMPENAMAIASIGREEITYPQNRNEEVFRKFPDDNILERMFYANKNGKNEYNIASIGISKSEAAGTGRIRVYLAGIAFILTRVNVENEVQNAEKDK